LRALYLEAIITEILNIISEATKFIPAIKATDKRENAFKMKPYALAAPTPVL